MTGLYKILTSAQWEAAQDQDQIAPNPHDVRDGFIHLCDEDQIGHVLSRHYAGQTGLVQVELDAARCEGEIRREASGSGQVFPHLYGTIPLSAVLAVGPAFAPVAAAQDSGSQGAEANGGSGIALDKTDRFVPQFNAEGLIPCVVTQTGQPGLLMMAWMNAQALQTTRESGYATFWSRSRGQLWRKGETSGNQMKVVVLRVDCDQDCLWLEVEPAGPACHTGADSCFFRQVEADGTLS